MSDQNNVDLESLLLSININQHNCSNKIDQNITNTNENANPTPTMIESPPPINNQSFQLIVFDGIVAHQIDVESSDTIEALKHKIHQQFPNYLPTEQKLYPNYRSIVELNDDTKLLSEYNLTHQQELFVQSNQLIDIQIKSIGREGFTATLSPSDQINRFHQYYPDPESIDGVSLTVIFNGSGLSMDKLLRQYKIVNDSLVVHIVRERPNVSILKDIQFNNK